jgi:hypothetical protein
LISITSNVSSSLLGNSLQSSFLREKPWFQEDCVYSCEEKKKDLGRWLGSHLTFKDLRGRIQPFQDSYSFDLDA